jgi:hypothetical protein
MDGIAQTGSSVNQPIMPRIVKTSRNLYEKTARQFHNNFLSPQWRYAPIGAMKIVMKLLSSACASENQSFSARFHTYPTCRGAHCKAVRVAWPAGFLPGCATTILSCPH